ncbi:MAG: hypothetical protein SWO11_21685 [Thermodesulfobacteriota bacterium]|nr:hypothetical protein [Thermodesulfobacteriota bacterium]
MGNDEDYIAKMGIDQLQSAGMSSSGTVITCPYIAVFQLPFFIEGFVEVEYSRKKII